MSPKSKPAKSINHFSTKLYLFSKGGTLIYKDKNVKYKIREELKLYKSNEIESSFLEIIENNRKKCYCWMN